MSHQNPADRIIPTGDQPPLLVGSDFRVEYLAGFSQTSEVGGRLPQINREPGQQRRTESRNHKDLVTMFAAACHGQTIRGFFYQAESVAEPLDRGAGYEDGAFERVYRLARSSQSSCREQPMTRPDGFVAGNHEQKCSG